MTLRGFAFGVLVTATAVTAVYGLKYHVQRLRAARDGLNAAVATEEARIGSLRAQWTYLSRPSRLADLASRYSELRPASPSQIMPLDALPMREDAALANADTRIPLPDGGEVALRFKPALAGYRVRFDAGRP